MADPNDVLARKLVRRELNRHLVDLTEADIQVMHGTVYIRGVVKTYKGGAENVREEMMRVGNLLKQRREIKDVILDCTYRS